MTKLEEMLKEIYDLMKAKELLKDVHREIGPYGHEQVNEKTRWKINDYFGFDDSE